MKKQLNSIIYLAFAVFSSNIQANLILNYGFEDGLTNWQNSFATVRTVDPVAYEGASYIYGDGVETFHVAQLVDLSLNFTGAEIDAGNLGITFGGWQSGWNANDVGQISIHLLDTNMTEIGVASIASFTSDHDWVMQSGATDLLAGTRYISYEFDGTRNFGANNDAYLDATFLEVVVVPVPAAALLFGSGLLGLLGIAGRKIKA